MCADNRVKARNIQQWILKEKPQSHVQGLSLQMILEVMKLFSVNVLDGIPNQRM